jgi:hypothetical protein
MLRDMSVKVIMGEVTNCCLTPLILQFSEFVFLVSMAIKWLFSARFLLLGSHRRNSSAAETS